MKRSGIDATSGALLGFVVELEPGVWLCDEVHGDPGRTLVLETATRYRTLSKAEAAMDIAKTYRVWPNHAIRPLYRKPNSCIELTSGSDSKRSEVVVKRFVGNPVERWRGQPHTTPCMGREEPLDHALIAKCSWSDSERSEVVLHPVIVARKEKHNGMG